LQTSKESRRIRHKGGQEPDADYLGEESLESQGTIKYLGSSKERKKVEGHEKRCTENGPLVVEKERPSKERT